MKKSVATALILTLFSIIFNTNNAVFAKITVQKIPASIQKLAKESAPDSEPIYVMDWYGKKVYRLKLPGKREDRFWQQDSYLLLDNKTARKTVEGEAWLLKFYIVNYEKTEEFKRREKLFEKNLNKYIEKKIYLTNKIDIESNQIPAIIEDYVNKYTIKGIKKRIVFIMKWNNSVIYKVNWSLEEETFTRGSFILFDGKAIRRLDEEEFQELRNTLKLSYMNYY